MTTHSDISEIELKHVFSCKAQQTDYDDLQLETIGANIKTERFYSGGSPYSQEAKQSEKQQEFRNKLQMILAQNADFARLYNRVNDMLRDAETLVEDSIELETDRLLEQTELLNDGLADANKLPDGTSVFMNNDGDIVAEDGRKLKADEIESLSWHDGAISYEEYLVRQMAVVETTQRIDRLRRYQVDTLGHMRERMQDKHDVVTQDELDGFEKDLSAKDTDITMSQDDNNSKATHDQTARIAIPTI